MYAVAALERPDERRRPGSVGTAATQSDYPKPTTSLLILRESLLGCVARCFYFESLSARFVMLSNECIEGPEDVNASMYTTEKT